MQWIHFAKKIRNQKCPTINLNYNGIYVLRLNKNYESFTTSYFWYILSFKNLIKQYLEKCWSYRKKIFTSFTIFKKSWLSF